MSLPDLLPANPSPLSQQLKSQTDRRLASILKTNYRTQFAQVAPELAAFRDATTGLVDGMDDATLCETFRNTTSLTTYDAYASLVSKFFQTPCRESEVVDLLAPGLPDYINRTSSTSGGVPKVIPKYNCLPKFDLSAVEPSALRDPPKRTTACVTSFMREPLNIVDHNDRLVKVVNIAFTSASVTSRSVLGLPPDTDEVKMATFISDFAAPYAAGFVQKWSSFLIIHGLFALGSKSLEQMLMSFVTTFVEMIQHIDVEFDRVVDCIANGTIPDLNGIAHVRHHLQSVMSPDPERAAELRSIGRPSSRPGWCSLAWPNLHSVGCIASGSFSSHVPLAQSFLGSDVKILARGYGSTEGRIAQPYNPFYPNHYKLSDDIVTEFLDTSQGDSIHAITQPWELEFGKQYEAIMTTFNGLWRYRLGDIVEIAGFDRHDGKPVIQFIGRRSGGIRFAHVGVTGERELRSAMASVAESTLGNVVDWTATLDDRQLPHAIGFFVELASERVCDAELARARLRDALSGADDNVARAFSEGSLGKPTVRIVARGTFSAFRQLKLDEGSNNLGQVKVPVILPKPAYVAWFSDRVAKEL